LRTQDVARGLEVIGSRAGALARFMGAYAQLARLPPPAVRSLDLASLVTRVVGLEPRLPVAVVRGPEVTIDADPDQIEQALINLVRNAADAALDTKGGVRVGWDRNRRGGTVSAWIDDDGLGLANTSNLFVPFFTTKPGGSGIGLALSRQIAEAHSGTLTLENRSGARGCRATLTLPLGAPG
jgi:signal transduction histidine kinase